MNLLPDLVEYDGTEGCCLEQDPTGFLNEGFRYRDLSTGTFLTRDPLGFLAGLNNYTYVRQNPWTHFDPEGLATNENSKNSSQPSPSKRTKKKKKVEPSTSAKKAEENKQMQVGSPVPPAPTKPTKSTPDHAPTAADHSGPLDSNNKIPNPIPPNSDHSPTFLDHSGPLDSKGKIPGAVPQGYSDSQTGSAGLDTDGAGRRAIGETTHNPNASLRGVNGDITPYAAQNPDPTTGSYTYPPGTTVYTINNVTGVGSVGVLGDNATPNNNYTGTLEVSPAMGNNLQVTKHNRRGRVLNSTNENSITTYYYPNN